MKRRMLSLVLALVMCLGLATPALADTGKSGDTISMNGAMDTSIDMIASVAFNKIFDTTSVDSSNSRGIDESNIDQVAYSYTFVPQENDPTVADVTLSFTIHACAQSYPVYVSGAVNAYDLSSGDTLWEGPITGTTQIGGKWYHVLAGFCKLDSSSDIQVSVTIQAADETDAIDPLIFVFGEQILTAQISQELAERASAVSLDSISAELSETSVATAQANGFTYIGGDTKGFNSSRGIKDNAQSSYGYINSGTSKFAVGIKSYCKNIDSYCSSMGYLGSSTSVQSFTIELKTNNQSPESYSWIASIDNPGISSGQTETLIEPIFSDIMGMLGVPTATISALLKGLKGSITYDVFANDSFVTFSFGLLQSARFDNVGSACIPVVFKLDYHADKYRGGSTYTFLTKITYRTVYVDNITNAAVYFYTNGYDTSKTVTINVR